MKTLEELLQSVEVIDIGTDGTMDVPESVRKVGPQFNHKVTTLVFHGPRYSQNGEDLSTTIPYVSFYKANKDVGQSLCENLIVDPNNAGMLYFTWTLRRPATDTNGALPFVICMRRTEGDELDVAWHSELNTDLRVSESIDCDIEDFDPEFKDELTEMLLGITDIVAGVKNGAAGGVSSWNDLRFDDTTTFLEWDGNTKGMECLEAVSDGVVYGRFYKYSDDTYTKEELAGSTLVLNSGNSIDITSESILFASGTEEKVLSVHFMMVTIALEDAVVDGIGTFTKGVWVFVFDETYPKSLTKKEVKKLDEKYIPDTIARKSDIGGVSSWNDLTDKPFGEESITYLEWDGDTTGLASIELVEDGAVVASFYKYSDEVYTMDELLGSTLVQGTHNLEGAIVDQTMVLTDQEVMFGDDTGKWISVNYMTVVVALEDFTYEGVGTFTKGMWVMVFDGMHAKSITKEGAVKPLDIKFIPNELYTKIDERIDAYIEEALGGDY